MALLLQAAIWMELNFM